MEGSVTQNKVTPSALSANEMCQLEFDSLAFCPIERAERAKEVHKGARERCVLRRFKWTLVVEPTMSEEGPDAGEEQTPRSAVVLDFLPHGRTDDDRPQYQKSPLAHALEASDFGLYELVLGEGERVTIGDEVTIDPRDEAIERVRRIAYDHLSRGARSELEHVVREKLDADENRLVEFYNEAGPITLRLHQLNLLPGIGDKLRDDIIDERKRGPFSSLADLEERISGLHRPMEIVVERVMEELRDDIIDARKRRPFESLADLEDRISGLHKPKEIVLGRIMEELRDGDVKYKLFVRQAKQ